jgi:hypothetical protein
VLRAAARPPVPVVRAVDSQYAFISGEAADLKAVAAEVVDHACPSAIPPGVAVSALPFAPVLIDRCSPVCAWNRSGGRVPYSGVDLVNDRNETPKERHDRELIELLNELRVAMPGVQVLFAFLLAVPFAQGWRRVDAFQRNVFFVSFICAAVSSILLMATSSIHRIGWRVSDKEKIVVVGTWLTIAGLVALAIAVSAAVLLVTDYIFSRTTAWVTAACLAALIVATWYVLALILREER